MKTPKSFTENIKKNIITEEMLGAALYSVNKRAKNCRDQERTYNNRRYDNYGTADKYREQKEKYYKLKNLFLTLIQPTCIHETEHAVRERIYSFDSEFYNVLEEDVVHDGEYWDNETKDFVQFVDILKPESDYFLYYTLGDFGFHHPIYESELHLYKNVPIVKLNHELVTQGKCVNDLISTQFVYKLEALIKSDNYILEI